MVAEADNIEGYISSYWEHYILRNITFWFCFFSPIYFFHFLFFLTYSNKYFYLSIRTLHKVLDYFQG